MTAEEDADLERALELSRKTYEEEEEHRRRSTQDTGDLISFESPEDPQQRAKINQIKRLYSQPSFENSANVAVPPPPGWRFNSPSLDEAGSSSSLPQPLFFYGSRPSTSSFSPFADGNSMMSHSQSTPFVSSSNGLTPPPLPPPPRPPKPPEIRRSVFPPAPVSWLGDVPPPLPPRTNRPPSVSFPPAPTFLTSTPTRPEQLNRASVFEDIFSPIANPFPTIVSASPAASSSQTWSETTQNHYSDPNSIYQPLTHLYVPYSMIKPNQSYEALLQGDLIDLSISEDTIGQQSTVDEIRREFDPLYRTPQALAPPPPMLSQRSSTSSIPLPAEGEPRPMTSAAATNAECDLDSYEIVNVYSPMHEHLDKIKSRGMITAQKHPRLFIAPIVDYETTYAESIKVIVHKDHTWPRSEVQSKTLTYPTKQTIELLITDILYSFFNDVELETIDQTQYGLKIYGSNQFLDRNSTFAQNLYTGHCLLNGQDVTLEISRQQPDNRVYDEPTTSWAGMKSMLNFNIYVDKEDVQNLLNQMGVEMKAFEAVIGNEDTLEVSRASARVKQQLGEICHLLNNIVPDSLYNELQSYLTTDMDDLAENRTKFVNEIWEFIEIYCKSTASSCCTSFKQETSGPVYESLGEEEYLSIKIETVHRIPDEWKIKYQGVYVTAELFHGTQVLDGYSLKTCRSFDEDPFGNTRIFLNVVAGFRKKKLCLYPKETRVVISLNYMTQTQTQQSSELRPLAYVSVPIVDENAYIRQGRVYAPMTIVKKEPYVVTPYGPYPYIKNECDPIIIMKFKNWNKVLQFPAITLKLQSVAQDFATLDAESREYLAENIEKADPLTLDAEDQEMFWQKRMYLTTVPDALPLVLASLSDWSYPFLVQVYQLLEVWVPLRPELALQLLLPHYPDEQVRRYAVKCLSTASTDFLYHSIPQFVEALRFELYDDSPLADFILELSTVNLNFTFDIYWQLQQRIDYASVEEFPYALRCQNLQQKIVEASEHRHLRNDISIQHHLIRTLSRIQDGVRQNGSDLNEQIVQLKRELDSLDTKLLHEKVRLPICSSFDCTGIRVNECSIFNSAAKPLKLVFRGLSKDFAIIYKKDDDMRQDAFVMKMVNEMDRIWKIHGLDLRIITFRVVPVGYKRGMGELVPNCATLREIHDFGGLTGALKSELVQKWLIKQNNNEFAFKEAVDNFIRSCAGWCVVSYVLGFGDRHNDNILITKNGHVFHIDFGKYMGDWQMAGGFRRDRVPFVFTKEMSYVINGGPNQSVNFQIFIDYCCQAFNLLRQYRHNLTNLLRIMGGSGIGGVNMKSIDFIEDRMMVKMSDMAASKSFTKMIKGVLEAISPRLNFFAHSMAQNKGKIFNRKEKTFSFVSTQHSMKSDGFITEVCVLNFEKHFDGAKIYRYKIQVRRDGVTVPTFVYRSFAEFEELSEVLKARFPSPSQIPSLPRSTILRSNVREVAKKRMFDVQLFLQQLFKLQVEISHSPEVYTFFHSVYRDNFSQQNDFPDVEAMQGSTQCSMNLRIQYNVHNLQLKVFVGHLKNLPLLPGGTPPDTYVKAYIRPDIHNSSKRKTVICRSNQHPTFNEELVYDNLPMELLITHSLEMSVWLDSGPLDHSKIFYVHMMLKRFQYIPEDRKGNKVIDGWFECAKSI